MSFSEVLAWLALAALAWFWFDSARAKEVAVAAARDACAADGLLFLDETVAIGKLWPARDEDGRLRLRRVYAFEYSDTGDNRRRGSIVLLGQRVVAVHVGLHLAASNTLLH